MRRLSRHVDLVGLKNRQPVVFEETKKQRYDEAINDRDVK